MEASALPLTSTRPSSGHEGRHVSNDRRPRHSSIQSSTASATHSRPVANNRSSVNHSSNRSTIIVNQSSVGRPSNSNATASNSPANSRPLPISTQSSNRSKLVQF